MLKKATFLGTLAGFGFLLGLISGSVAAETPTGHSLNSAPSATPFRPIEQPLGNKVAVTIAGLGLISLELWWFLLSKSTSEKAVASSTGIQKVTVGGVKKLVRGRFWKGNNRF